MKALAINTGSSSLKFKFFDSEKVLLSGTFKNHEENRYELELTTDNRQLITITKKDYEYPIDYIFDQLKSKNIITDISEIEFIVHRIVHGGEEFTNPCELNSENIERIKKYNQFAPLHNPFALEKINQIKVSYPSLKQYAVFDTSFHLTNKREDFLYGLPYGYYENLKVRRFGFHGIAHEYVASQVQNLKFKISNSIRHISCHLGSGSSVCAILEGVSIDHSFGFTPDENLIMATRVGEIDYDAVMYVKKKMDLSDEDIEKLINQESGLVGISGISKDMKVLLKEYETNERAKLAIDMYVSAIVKYISQFYVRLNGCDYLTFSGGIGVGSDIIRQMICTKLEILGIRIDKSKNVKQIDVKKILDLTDSQSKTKIMVIPTDEELEMVNQVKSRI